MGMVVQHNLNAMSAYNKLNSNVAGLKKSSEKLSSGYRINRAGDDAAGLAISEKMRSQIRGLNQAVRNSQDGINMIQTFEGAANETHSILQRMKELASESANGTYQTDVDRDAIQLEFDQLNDELNQIADTDFNGVTALNGGRMADGTVANNTTVLSKLPTIDGVQSTSDSSFVYSTNVRGTVDSAMNGTVNINGVKVTLKAGKAQTAAGADGAYTPDGAAEGSSYNTGTDISYDAAKKTWAGTFKATEVFQIGTDDTEITINGTKYTIDQANGKLFDSDGTEIKNIDGGTVTVADGKVTVTDATYTVGTDGTITAGATTGGAAAGAKVVGAMKLAEGVSSPDAYEHGARNLTYTNEITLQVGARSKDAVTFNFNYNTNGMGELNADLDISARGLGTDQLSLNTQESANAAIDKIDNAINKASMVRATFGATQNRLEHKIDNLTTTSTNLQEAESAIRDTDMASEMMNYTKYNILQQAAQSMLAQANQQPQSVLQLLG